MNEIGNFPLHKKTDSGINCHSQEHRLSGPKATVTPDTSSSSDDLTVI